MYEEAEPVGFTPRYMNSTLVLIQGADMLPLSQAHGLIPFKKNGMLNRATRELIKTTPENALYLGPSLRLHIRRHMSCNSKLAA